MNFKSFLSENKKDYASLLEGAMSDIHQLANDSKDIESFTKDFFKQFGAKIKKTSDSVGWVESLYDEMTNEAYDGNMADFKYEFPTKFEEATGNNTKAIKKIAKKGKAGYEVRTSTYMSEPEMKLVADAMGMELKSYLKSTNVAISVFESLINEAKFDKKKLMKAMKADDGIIQLANGEEYLIYAYDNGNDENDAMWNDKSIFALDQDGGEHEINYSDIVSYNESAINERDIVRLGKLDDASMVHKILKDEMIKNKISRTRSGDGEVTVYTNDIPNLKKLMDDLGISYELYESRLMKLDLILNKKQTEKIAQQVADEWTKEDSKKSGVKYNVTPGTEPHSFDLDIEDKEGVDPRATGEFAGGSYFIRKEGDVLVIRNAATGSWSVATTDLKGKNFKVIPSKDSTNKRLDESKITLKRRYTENHPALTVGKRANVRNKMLEAIGDGKITQEEFNDILKELSTNGKRWAKNNTRYFNVSEEGISLSKFGNRALASITINEEEPTNTKPLEMKLQEATDENPGIWVPSGFDKAIAKLPNSQITRDVVLKVAKKHKVNPDEAISYVEYGWSLDLNENTNTNMKTQFIYESFGDFINSLNESESLVIEAKSAKVTKKEWPYVEFKVGSKLHKVEFDYEDVIDNHGNEGQDQYWLGKDDDGKEWSIDVYADYNGNVEEVHYDTIVAESVINEAFKSSKLRNLLTMSDAMGWGKNDVQLPKAFYQLTKMKLDQIGDEDLIDMTPKEAYKAYANNREAVVFYIVDNAKHNPFGTGQVAPGILALTRGKDFLGVQYEHKGYRSKKNTKTLKGGDDRMAVGGNKAYKGYDATGVSSIKRAADLADRAIAFSLNNPTKSSAEDVKRRVDQKAGAAAFESDQDFKKANKARYQEILATKASKLPLDKMVADSIDALTAQIKDGLAKNEKGRYGDIIIGRNSKGREAKMRDASNHMSQILDDYSRYVDYVKQAEEAKAEKYTSSYAEKESQNYAKEIKDKVSKIKKFDYAW